MKNLIAGLFSHNKHKGRKRCLVGLLAILLVIGTLNRLTFPGLTLEKETFCGLEEGEEHVHTEECFVEPQADMDEPTEHALDSDEQLTTGDQSEDGQTADDSVTDGQSTDDQATDEQMMEGSLVYEEDDVTITASFGKEAKLPEGTKLQVSEITDRSDYSDYLAQADEAVGDTESVKEARFFDIAFVYNGTEIEPAAQVDIMLECRTEKSVSDATIQAVHLPEGETAEVLQTEVKENDEVTEVRFASDSFSVYGIVYTMELSIPYLSDNGLEYEVTVTYDKAAQIPKNARLQVTPYSYNSEEYKKIRDSVFENPEDMQGNELQTLDISIISPDGETIEPKAPVQVKLRVKELSANAEVVADSMEIMHLDASSGEIEVEKVADAKEIGNIAVENETAVATFALDSFSQFAVTYGSYVSVTVHYVDVDGNELPGNTAQISQSTSQDTTLTLADIRNRMSQSGYTYRGAHYGSYNGQVITKITGSRRRTEGSLLTNNTDKYFVTFYNNDDVVARLEYENKIRPIDVYLVYAPNDQYYVQDTIGEDGCLTVYNGTSAITTGTDENVFVRWYRSSDGTDYEEVTASKALNGNYNIPEMGGPKVNVSIDEGANQYYKAEIYSIDENKQENIIATTEVYHVPYYDDVRNGNFETPHNDGSINDTNAHKWYSNYQVENGKDGVIWKTTGTIADGRDIEIANGSAADGTGANKLGETLRNYNFAYMPEGTQCAELNCETAGSLYQDVLTIPGSQLYWSLYHRARGKYEPLVTDKTQNRATDTMYVVAMSKELAEKYDVTTQEKVLEILRHVNDPGSEFHDVEIVKITTTNQGNGTMTFMNSNATVTVPPTYFGNLGENETRRVRDEGGEHQTYKYGNTDWHYYTGNFSIPQDQYLTRFFFVAGDTASGNNTMGNFLDGIKLSDSVPTPNAGQATVVVTKTVRGLDELPENYATRIETAYTVTNYQGIDTVVEKNSDYYHYMTQPDESGKPVSTGSWTFPISISPEVHSIVFSNGEEKAPEDTSKTDVVDGYTQTTSYVLRKQSDGQSSPTQVAQGDGKVIPAEDLSNLTVHEKDIIYIDYVNTYIPKPSVSIWKTDIDGHVITTGAEFALYKAGDFDDDADEPKQNVTPIVSGTTDENGILSLEELDPGEYRLVETSAPEGYILLESAVKITVTGSTVTAIQGSSNCNIAVKGDETWVEGQPDKTIQIQVWNNPGAELPNTGGPGTRVFSIFGMILVLGAAMLACCRRMRCLQLN